MLLKKFKTFANSLFIQRKRFREFTFANHMLLFEKLDRWSEGEFSVQR